jgi:TonB family protein
MQEEYKSKKSEPEELSTTALSWIFGISTVVLLLMFASIFGKGYLYYGGVAFGFMTAFIAHMTVWFLSQTSRTTKILIVHGTIWAIALLIAMYWRTKRENRELAEYGVVYNAPVIELYTVYVKRRSLDMRFRARIRYEVGGKVYVKSVLNTGRVLQISDTVRIVYSSKDHLLFGVAAFIKRKIPNSLDTAKYQTMAPAQLATTEQLEDGDRFPQFRGGSSAFYEYIRRNLIYPAVGIVNRRSGQVHLSFIIDKDGTVRDVHVTKGINQLYDEAAVKVLKESPKWLPGMKDGEAIKVKYNIPIKFSL